ncbi:O-antigen ligase family protein [Limnohabitans sp. Bal53]|uniref:O-antigen ligase family protein n=1 Tax=Limnohabitans sp. Bal53 TaxID=1977910 RepID=UPI000D3D7E78|nr:O-antigen ligase family protein [Limnohabitans sp. Bal53]PUE42384.1 hypothetical protein B9Z50_00460 [Limnohabitans sp. Bal53]
MPAETNANVKTFYVDRHVSILFRRWALLVAILLSGGMLLFPRPLLLMLLLVFILLASKGNGLLRRSTALIWGLLAMILAITLIRPGPVDPSSLVIRYANFTAALLLLCLYIKSGSDAVQSDLMSILPWFGWQAIFTFLLANIAPFLFITINIEDFQFSTIFLLFNYHELMADSTGFKRPNGFFYEPGVFQIYLNIYLYLSLMVYKIRRHIAISTAAVFCTLSTTGLIIASLIWVASFLTTSPLQRTRKKNIMSILLLTAIIPILFLITYSNVEDKFTGEMQGSAIARQYDLFTGLNIIREYPLLGIGFDHKRYLELLPYAAFTDTLLSEESALSRSSSNGIIYLFYSLGIPLGLIILFSIYKQKLFPHRKIFFAIIFLSLLSEAIIYTPFILLVAYSALVGSKKINKNQSERIS